jgi:hypothetical protein
MASIVQNTFIWMMLFVFFTPKIHQTSGGFQKTG